MSTLQYLMESSTVQAKKFLRDIGGEEKLDRYLLAACRKLRKKFPNAVKTGKIPCADNIGSNERWFPRFLKQLPSEVRGKFLRLFSEYGIQELVRERMIALRKSGKLKFTDDDDSGNDEAPKKSKGVKTSIPITRFDKLMQGLLEDVTDRMKKTGEPRITLVLLNEELFLTTVGPPNATDEDKQNLLERWRLFTDRSAISDSQRSN